MTHDSWQSIRQTPSQGRQKRSVFHYNTVVHVQQQFSKQIHSIFPSLTDFLTDEIKYENVNWKERSSSLAATCLILSIWSEVIMDGPRWQQQHLGLANKIMIYREIYSSVHSKRITRARRPSGQYLNESWGKNPRAFACDHENNYLCTTIQQRQGFMDAPLS